MARFNILRFVTLVVLVIATRGNPLPSCYVEPYGTALNSTICGPLDGICMCTSSTYLYALQNDIPQACNLAEQSPIFSYINAACSEFGVNIALTPTSMPLTTPILPTATITSMVTTVSTKVSTEISTKVVTTTDIQAAGAASCATSYATSYATFYATSCPSALGAATTSTCPKPSLSSGVNIGAVIGAFVGGGVLFAAAAACFFQRRRPRVSPTPLVSPEAFAPPTPTYPRYSPIAETRLKQPRVAEMMMNEPDSTYGRPAEMQ